MADSFLSTTLFLKLLLMIKNIIFDFGGVIYDVRYENVNDAFLQLGASTMAAFYSKMAQTEEMNLLEVGKMSVPDFRSYIRRKARVNLSDEQIDWAINAVMIGVPRRRVQLLMKLRGLAILDNNIYLPRYRPTYRTFLFSNTNEICYTYFMRELCAEYGFNIFDVCFEKAYFSHFLHTKKPSVEGFQYILKANNLVADETLFVDDIAVNAQAACRAGLMAHHLTESDICDLFDDNGILKPDISIIQ